MPKNPHYTTHRASIPIKQTAYRSRSANPSTPFQRTFHSPSLSWPAFRSSLRGTFLRSRNRLTAPPLFFQVNSGKRLAELCGIPRDKKKTTAADCRCVVVTSGCEGDVLPAEDPPLTDDERQLTDFYECTLEEFPRPVIQLPIWKGASGGPGSGARKMENHKKRRRCRARTRASRFYVFIITWLCCDWCFCNWGSVGGACCLYYERRDACL